MRPGVARAQPSTVAPVPAVGSCCLITIIPVSTHLSTQATAFRKYKPFTHHTERKGSIDTEQN